MHLHIEKAIKNCKFLEAIETHLPDDFFEWKITVVFYIAVHSVRALLKAKYKTYVGSSHKAIDNVIKSDGTYPFPLKQYRAYQALYVYSRDARYKVYDDTFGFNAKEHTSELQ